MTVENWHPKLPYASAPDAPQTLHSGLPLSWAGAAPLSLENRRSALLAKRASDILLSLLGIIALAPLLILVALAIKLSSRGPVLFRQARTGVGGGTFHIYKFRSMYADRSDTTGIQHTTAGDDRVTPIGRLLRRTSIDELPQLFNVLRGDMAMVGPRPHVPGMLVNGTPYAELVPYYAMRTAMPPGVTGWAQINRLRGEVASREHAIARVEHDIAYIQNYSVWLDLKCIWLTLRNEFIGGNAV
ncbi:sugar transferase [Devosia sp. 2618]|uniref:sugar transferase n=1 Tax=Devosia sp. 2618 TaxID=3156454 RepID=UPI0033985997